MVSFSRSTVFSSEPSNVACFTSAIRAIEAEKVVFGAHVTLAELDDDEHVTYYIVGSEEADIANMKISIESPIARALIGKEVGDEVKVKTPKGIREFEIIQIEYR